MTASFTRLSYILGPGYKVGTWMDGNVPRRTILYLSDINLEPHRHVKQTKEPFGDTADSRGGGRVNRKGKR